MAARVRYATGNGDSAGTNTCAAISLAGGNVSVAGYCIILGFKTDGFRTIASISDNGGTTYVQAPDGAIGGSQFGDQGRVDVWYGFAAGVNASQAGQNVVVVLDNTNSEGIQLDLWEVSGLNTDQTGIAINSAASNGGATTSHSTGSVTPANASGFAVAIANRGNNTWGDGSTFTEETTNGDRYYAGYVANPPASSLAFAFTSSTGADSVQKIVAFVGAGGGGGSNIAAISNYHRMMGNA